MKTRLRTLLALSLAAPFSAPFASAEEPREGTSLAAPASAERFTLEQALSEMERLHPLLVASDENRRALEGDALAAGLWTNPLVSASYANAWNSSYDRAGLFNASFTQFLELSGSPAAQRRSLELAAKASGFDRSGLRNELSFRLEESAIRYSLGRELVAVLRDYGARVKEVTRIVEVRVQSGAVPHYDADRIAIVESIAEADLADAEAALLGAEADLRASIGPGAVNLHGQIVYDLFESATLPSEAELRECLREKRPEIRAAKVRVDSARAAVDAAKKSVFRGVAFTVGMQYGQAPGQVDLGAGVAIPLPLLDHGQGTVDAAEARAAATRATALALTSPLELALSGTYAEVVKREGASKSYLERAGRARDTMLLEAQAGYQGGKLSVLELTDAYTAWRDARLRGLGLAAQARLSEIELERLVGTSLRLFRDERKSAERSR